MKKSTLKEAIKSKIKSLLSEGLMTTDEAFRVLRDMQNIYVDKRKKDLMGRAIDALQAAEVSRMMDRERSPINLKDFGHELNESLNPEVFRDVNRYIARTAKRYDYSEQDAVYAIMAALEQRKSDTKYDMPGFGDTMDALDDISIREEKKEMTDAGKNKRSKLKEAIKAEIKSVLSEEIQLDDIVTLTRGGDKLRVVGVRQLFASDKMAYRVEKLDGTKFNANVDFPEIGDETAEYSSDQLRLAEGDLREEDEKLKYPEEGEVVFYEGEPHEVMRIVRHNDGQGPRIYIRPKEESAILGKKDTFWVRPGDIEGTDLREEEEPTSAELKKKDSIAATSNKLQKLTKKMKDIAGSYKRAKKANATNDMEKYVEQLKKMTKEKKQLEKAL